MHGHATRTLILAVLIAMTTACGGGGGGGGGEPATGSTGGSPTGGGTSGGGTSGGGSSTVPLDPPAAPAQTYSGSRNTAVLDDVSVSVLADTVFAGIMLSFAVSDENSDVTLPRNGVIDLTFPGPQGGSVHVTGRVVEGVGWVRYDLTAYRASGITWDGTQVFQRQQINNGQQDSLTSVQLHDLRTQSALGDVTLRGSLTRRSTVHQFAPSSSVVTGNIEFRNNATRDNLLVENVELSYVPNAQLHASIDGTGRLYHGDLGWVDFSFGAPWFVPAGTFFPTAGGPLVAETASGTFFEIETLNSELVSLQYTSSLPGLTDRAARVVWPQTFESQTGRSPVDRPIADGGASQYARRNQAIILNGAYSTHPQTNYTTFEWELMFRPPGSQAGLNSHTTIQPALTMDRAGRYLYRLEVSDGQRTGTDFVVLTADDTTNNPFSPIDIQLLPRATATVGSPLSIDLNRFHSGNPAPLSVQVVGPTGSSLIGVNSSTLKATFVPSAPGIYVAVVSNGDLSMGGVNPADFMPIEVGAAQHFTPAVSFPIPDDAGQAALGDLNADGLDDLVFAYLGDGGPNAISVYLSNGKGFAEPLTLAGGIAGHVRIGDINDDGRADIVTTAVGGISTFRQQLNGSFENELPVPGNCAFKHTPRSIEIVDINGDGLDDVVTDGSCSNSIELFIQQSNGSLAPGHMVASPGEFQPMNLAAGDLDGDGLVDVAVAARSGSLPAQPSVRIHYGQSDGSLGAPTYLAGIYQDTKRPALAVADLDGDGDDDLLFSTSQPPQPMRMQLQVFLQTDDGELEAWQAFDVTREILDIRLVDVDGDGRLDMILDVLDYGLTIHFQLADHTFAPLPTGTALHFEREMRVPPEGIGDTNGDGLPDIAITGGGNAAFLLLGTR